jgi:hypothetical protein
MSVPSADHGTTSAQRARQTTPAARARDVRAQWTTPAGLLQLQRTVGNRAVSRLIQAKLIVGSADDPYEREAERVAARFGAPASVAEWSGQRIQALPQTPAVEPEGGEAGEEIERQLSASKGAGTPLPPDTRALMEDRLGADFSAVRVHTGTHASALNRQLGAIAFTHGTDIYISEGQYNPASSDGQRLLANELTHVVQQTGGAQRQGGHEPISRSKPESIQRLITSDQLKELAGEPHRDRLFGLVPMSVAYKAVLTALDEYHKAVGEVYYVSARGHGNDVFPRLQGSEVAKVLGKLTAVAIACEKYVRSHANDTRRTPHIQAIINDIPVERAAIQTIQDNPRNYPDMSLRNAIRMARIVQAADVSMLDTHNKALKGVSELRSQTQGARPVPESVENAKVEDLSKEAVETYKEEMEQTQQQLGERPRAVHFRGNTPATKIASALTYEVGQEYVKSVVVPALSKVLFITEESARDVQEIASAYENFVRIFDAQGVAKVPVEFAKFCYSLYKAATEKMGEQQAYLLVSSQIFLRMINPMITTMAANVPEGQPGKSALIKIAALLQQDANNVPRTGGTVRSYAAQIQSFVKAVISRGERFTV